MPSDARISTALPAHPKFKKIVRRLGDSGGLRVMLLFLWTAANRPDGDLSGMTGEDIEIAVDWNGEPGAFAAALADVGFLDGAERGYAIHDWAAHQPWAAGSDDRAEASRWAALCRRYGRAGAAERMPDYAERMRVARDSHADGSEAHAGRSEKSADRMRKSATPTNPLCPDSDPDPDSTPGSDTDTDTGSDSDTDSDPNGVQVAPSLALVPAAGKPATPKASPASKTGPTWAAYALAYERRYAIAPVRNAKSSALLSQLVDRIGAADAPEVAAYYVGHNSAYYVQRGHSLAALVADAEKLRTEWATKRQITNTEARRTERTQAGLDVWAGLLKPEVPHVEQ